MTPVFWFRLFGQTEFWIMVSKLFFLTYKVRLNQTSINIEHESEQENFAWVGEEWVFADLV